MTNERTFSHNSCFPFVLFSSNQKNFKIKSGADLKIQKGVAGTRGGRVRGPLPSAPTLNPQIQRNITRKSRSQISNAGRSQSEEQRTTNNAVPTDI